MLSSLRTLAAAADRLLSDGHAALSETSSAVTIAALSAASANALIPDLVRVGWQYDVVDAAGELAVESALSADYAPFIITVRKPSREAGLQVVTMAGLRAFLRDERADEVWEVALLDTPFSTMAVSFVPWGASEVFSPSAEKRSPRQIVRDYAVPPVSPKDIRVWIPRVPVTNLLWRDPVFQEYADLSAQSLMLALAAEIKTDGSLVFKGPPNVQLDKPATGAAQDLGASGYDDLRNIAAWVYENDVETERRHGMFVSQFGRMNPSEKTASIAFLHAGVAALDGARLAYQLSLSDLTREAIKAQDDLRKSVADDTAKLADNTRQVVTAVAASLATSIGLVAAKLGTNASPWVLQSIAFVAAAYVISIIASGWQFMNVQRNMRRNWRSRLYRFVPDSDYQAMVIDPAGRAEAMFKCSSIIGGIIAATAVAIVFSVGQPSEVPSPPKHSSSLSHEPSSPIGHGR